MGVRASLPYSLVCLEGWIRVYGMTYKVSGLGAKWGEFVDSVSPVRRLSGRKGSARAAKWGGPMMGSSRSSGFLLSRGLACVGSSRHFQFYCSR